MIVVILIFLVTYFGGAGFVFIKFGFVTTVAALIILTPILLIVVVFLIIKILGLFRIVVTLVFLVTYLGVVDFVFIETDIKVDFVTINTTVAIIIRLTSVFLVEVRKVVMVFMIIKIVVLFNLCSINWAYQLDLP